ncbi:hypothetical protein HDV05_001234 [Chytridiales sp. JEL 0842]|nr:hypothetical protein HDV05_001234 [Chytridiales sp. JEL 0842]
MSNMVVGARAALPFVEEMRDAVEDLGKDVEAVLTITSRVPLNGTTSNVVSTATSVEKIGGMATGLSASAAFAVATPPGSPLRSSFGSSNNNFFAPTATTTVTWSAFISAKTLFIKVPESDTVTAANGFGFKESIVAVLDLADDVLKCSNIVICLEKNRKDLASILRSFLFVGFEMVHPSVYNVGHKYVMVAQEL